MVVGHVTGHVRGHVRRCLGRGWSCDGHVMMALLRRSMFRHAKCIRPTSTTKLNKYNKEVFEVQELLSPFFYYNLINRSVTRGI